MQFCSRINNKYKNNFQNYFLFVESTHTQSIQDFILGIEKIMNVSAANVKVMEFGDSERRM